LGARFRTEAREQKGRAYLAGAAKGLGFRAEEAGGPPVVATRHRGERVKKTQGWTLVKVLWKF